MTFTRAAFITALFTLSAAPAAAGLHCHTHASCKAPIQSIGVTTHVQNGVTVYRPAPNASARAGLIAAKSQRQRASAKAKHAQKARAHRQEHAALTARISATEAAQASHAAQSNRKSRRSVQRRRSYYGNNAFFGSNGFAGNSNFSGASPRVRARRSSNKH